MMPVGETYYCSMILLLQRFHQGNQDGWRQEKCAISKSCGQHITKCCMWLPGITIRCCSTVCRVGHLPKGGSPCTHIKRIKHTSFRKKTYFAYRVSSDPFNCHMNKGGEVHIKLLQEKIAWE